MSHPHSTNAVGLAAYFNDQRYSDLEIRCRGDVFKVHRVIVCAKSEFFRRRCEGGFGNTDSGIDMSEDEPLVVKYMLMFMYTGKLMIEDIEKAEKIELSYFSFVAGLHAIADKYLVTDLIAHTTKIVQDDVPSFSWYSLTDIFSRIAYIYDLLPENNTVLRRPLCQVIKRDYELMQRFLTDFGTSTENCYTINAAMDLIHKTAASNPLFALDLVKMTFPTALTTLPLLDTGFESTRRQVPEACVEEYFKGMMEDWDRWLKLPDSKGPVEEDGTIPWFVYKPAEPVEPYIPPSSGYQIAMDLLK